MEAVSVAIASLTVNFGPHNTGNDFTPTIRSPSISLRSIIGFTPKNMKKDIAERNSRLGVIRHAENPPRIQEIKPPLEKWLSFPFLPTGLNNKIIALYRRFLRLFGYKVKSYVHDGAPALHFTEYRKIAKDMVAGKRPYIFNDENWGLGQESLEEFTINTADWDKEYEKN